MAVDKEMEQIYTLSHGESGSGRNGDPTSLRFMTVLKWTSVKSYSDLKWDLLLLSSFINGRLSPC